MICLLFFGILPCALNGDVGAELDRTGVHSGLVLLLGDEEITAANQLARTGRWLVHQLVPEPRVEALRLAALTDGTSGRVVVDALPESGKLPHPDRLCDFVVVRAKGVPIADEELHRVLNVGGKLLIEDARKTWTHRDRRAERDIDFWTHKWHGPSGQVLSLDRKAGPPTAIQWSAGPALADGAIGGKHPVIGAGAMAAVDSVDGAVMVRSAGNGLPRWRSDFALSPQAELLIDDDRLLCRPAGPLGTTKGLPENGPLTAFDLSGGERVTIYEDAPRPSAEPGKRTAFPSTLAVDNRLVVVAGKELSVLDRGSGKPIWSRTLESNVWFSPIVLDDTLVVCECSAEAERLPRRGRIDNAAGAAAIVAFSLERGEPRWRLTLEQPAPPLVPLIAAEGLLFLHTTSYQSRDPGAYIAAIEIASGKQLWRENLPEGTAAKWSATDSASRLICREGKLHYIGGHSLGKVVTFDARTGRRLHDPLNRPKFVAYGGECSGSLATPNWLIMSGVTWWDRELKTVSQPAARSACGTGVFPAQGMVFANPTGCDCTQYARGYLGLSCTPLPPPVSDAERLVRGDGKPSDNGQPSGNADAADWPTLLGNPHRSGSTRQRLPDELRVAWRQRVAPESIEGPLLADRRRDEYWNGPLTAPVAAGDMVVVGLSDAHAIAALDATTGHVAAVARPRPPSGDGSYVKGRVRWQIPVGGPIDTPPTIYRGLCLFGTQDGYVQAVSLADGRLVWKFLAAPSRRPAVLNGRLASAFPVPGSVLVMNDSLLVMAGSHSYLGGVYAWVLDPMTGEVRHKSTILGGDVPTQANMLFNDVLTAGHVAAVARPRPPSGDGSYVPDQDAYCFLHFRIGFDAQQLPVPKRESGTIYPAQTHTAMLLDRRAAVIRFPHNQRGGSTHGWKSKMTSGPVSAFRVVRDGELAYGLEDPTFEMSRYGKGTLLFAQKADVTRHSEIRPPIWSRGPADLESRESYSALIKAGDRLYLGGGRRDGGGGFVQVVSASDGKLLKTYDLPAQVSPCGLAASQGRLIVSCMDGYVVCLTE